MGVEEDVDGFEIAMDYLLPFFWHVVNAAFLHDQPRLSQGEQNPPDEWLWQQEFFFFVALDKVSEIPVRAIG